MYLYNITFLLNFSDQNVYGAESLLKKYTFQLCNHALEILPLASNLASKSWKYRCLVLQILANDVVDVLLPELIVCLVLLQVEVPLLMHQANWLQLFNPLLDALDEFNKLIRDVEKEDIEDLSWPGIFGDCLFPFSAFAELKLDFYEQFFLQIFRVTDHQSK